MFTPFLLVIFRSMDYMDKDIFPKAHGEGNIGKGIWADHVLKGIWTKVHGPMGKNIYGQGHMEESTYERAFCEGHMAT